MEICYPNGKIRAMTFSYDDGEIYDRNLIDIFNRYGMKGTFHLNSGWIDKKGYITKEEIPDLYKEHEIACHGAGHQYLRQLPPTGILREVEDDRRALEEYSGRFIRGFSYAFGEYSEEIINIIKSIGIVYARTADTTGKFRVPDDFMRWAPTCHHEEPVFELLNSFLNPPQYRKLSLMYIYGHSFEFERNKNWDYIEKFCKEASDDPDTWYATNMEVYEYLSAVRALIGSMDGRRIMNPSLQEIWFLKANGEPLCLKPGAVLYKENE